MDENLNEVIVFRPIVCYCERDCCAKEERKNRYKSLLELSGTEDFDTCCDESHPTCQQACCAEDEAGSTTQSGLIDKSATPSNVSGNQEPSSLCLVPATKERLEVSGNKRKHAHETILLDGSDSESCCQPKSEKQDYHSHCEDDSCCQLESSEDHSHASDSRCKPKHDHSHSSEEDSCCKPKRAHSHDSEEDSCCKPKHGHLHSDEEDSCCKPKRGHSHNDDEESSCCKLKDEHSHDSDDSCCKPKGGHSHNSSEEDSCCKPKANKGHLGHSHSEDDSCCDVKNATNTELMSTPKDKSGRFSKPGKRNKKDKKGAAKDTVIDLEVVQDSDKSKMLMSVTGMTCASCAKTVEDHLKKLSGVLSVKISVTTAKVEVSFHNKVLTEQVILDHVNTLSFKAELVAAALTTTIEVVLTHKQQQSDVETFLKSLEGINGVQSGDIEKRRVDLSGQKRTELVVSYTIDYDPECTGARTIGKALNAAFPNCSVVHKRAEDSIQKGMKKEVRGWMNRLIAVGALTLPVIIFAFVLPSIDTSKEAIDTKVYNGLTVKILVEFFLTVPIQFFFALPFYKSAYESLKYVRRANMDLLVCLSTTAAFVYSLVISIILLVNPSLVNGETFYETSAILLFLIILGRFIEVYVNSKTSNILSQIMLLQAENAVLVGKFPREVQSPTKLEHKAKHSKAKHVASVELRSYVQLEEKTISVYQIERGDVLKVVPGDKIPTDGIIVDGKSNINESMLTGESRPVFKQEGESVFGGTINKDGALLIKAVKVPGENTLDVITNLIEKTQMSKAKIERQADKISSYFVPVIFGIAAIVFVVWITLASVGVVTNDLAPFPLAMGFTIAVLVVSCPCALALSAPNAIIIGTGVAAKLGILFKGGEAIEACRSLDTICFDKTGTLTTGVLSVTEILVLNSENFTEQDMLSHAASIEQSSEHPLSQAIVDKAKELKCELVEPKNTKTVPGMGIYGTVNGKKVYVGNSKLMKKAGVAANSTETDEVEAFRAAGKTVVFVAIEGQLVGLIAIYDTPKPESKQVIEYLHKKSIQVWMISGDHERTAISVADQLGIAPEFVVAGVLPKDKLKKIEELQNSGRTVAMVGDGINDGPALAQANIGIAVGSASNLAQEASDVVLMTNNLTQLLVALHLAVKVNKRIRLNLGWSFLWNSLIIPIAAGVFYPLSFTLPAAFAGLSEIFSIFPVIVLSVLLKTYRIPKSISDLTPN